MSVQPYLHFEGRCEEAIEFYKSKLGAEVVMMLRFKDNPEPPPAGTQPPGIENKIMHANLTIGGSTVLLSDGRMQGSPAFQGFSLSFTVKTVAESEKLFASLSDGGQIKLPLTKTFFSPSFGMVADRFGVSWLVYVAP